MKNTPMLGRKATLGLLAAVLASGALLPSCKKEVLDPDTAKGVVWNPEIAVPLVDTRITVDDILDRFDDEEVIVLLNDTLALRYRGEVFSFTAEEILVMPDASLSAPGIPLTATNITEIEVSPGSTTISGGTDFPFAPISGASLDLVTFKGGTLSVTASHNIPHNAVVNITIPSLLDAGGTAYTTTLNLTPTTVTATDNRSLAGYRLDLTVGGATNEVTASMSATYTDGGGSAVVGQNLQLQLDFNGLQYSRIDGNIGTQNIPVPLDSVRVRVFENSTDGTINWEDPRLRAYFYNSFGVPMQMTLNRLDGRSAPTGVILPITGLGPILSINAPATPGSTALTQFSLTKANPGSNIDAVAALRPDFIIYDVLGITNPSGSGSNFILDSSRVRLDMEVELPFHGTASNFTVADTIKLVASDSSIQANDIEEIESILFRMYVNNGFPAQGYAQIYFLDSTNTNRIDSLIVGDNTIFKQAVIDASGRVVEKSESTIDFKLTRPQLESLVDKGVRNLLVVSKVESNDAGAVPVIIFRGYHMDLKLGMMIELKRPLEFN